MVVQGGKAIITKGATVLLTATLRHGVYFVDSLQLGLAALEIKDPKLQIWHDRLGHLGEEGIKQLMGMSTGIKPIPPGTTCETCASGRQKEQPHTGSTKKGTIRYWEWSGVCTVVQSE